MAIGDWLMWIRLAMKIMELLDSFFDTEERKNEFIAEVVTEVQRSGVVESVTGSA